ncbi:MAG: ribonuclease III [Gammaproteobacteria bacterium]|nr:ribonuclease III [Gammaproteobacteria bacterium]
MEDPALRRLQKTLGYTFNNLTHLRTALTHRSAAPSHNERMEFLGDSVLGMVAAEMLYEQFPNMREGDLTRARAQLVKRETLVQMARELNLSAHLQLGQGELRSGGRQRESILADTFEAVVGAMYLDGGLDRARSFLNEHLAPRMNTLAGPAPKDPKTRLQEFLQGKGITLPSYEVRETTGQSHNQTFHVVCFVPSLAIEGYGCGGSRRRAEQDAAAGVLGQLSISDSA